MCLSATAILAGPVFAGEDTVDPAGIRGTLVLCGGGAIPELARREFLDAAGNDLSRVVVIPTAGDDDTLVADGEALSDIWKTRGAAHVAVLHTRSRDEADTAAFVEPLLHATGVWIGGGRQTQLASIYSGTRVERELQAVLDRGGVVGGTSAGAACLSRIMIVRGDIYRVPGLGLVPQGVIDQHFLVRERKERLFRVLEQHPRLVGYGIDEGTALVMTGRSLRCVGNSTVTVCFANTGRRDREELVLGPGDQSDLTLLRRRALARMAPAFPPEQVGEPIVSRGALVIVGGGAVPPRAAKRFVELAGGGQAPIVVLPTASDDAHFDPSAATRFLERAGASNLHVLRERTRNAVESPEFLEKVNSAGGIWFGGGRQWRFVDAYEGTAALEAFRGVLARGGVIGGSSAGATIQGEYLVRGSPLGNEQMMCTGYECGFAFLPGTAIDQHVSQRKRFADLAQLVNVFPQLLGIGLDESTAIVVERSVAEVVGNGQAHFFDRRPSRADGRKVFKSLAAGARYDLVERQPVANGSRPHEPAGR